MTLAQHRAYRFEATRRTDAILRILSERSSVPHEAVRLGLDVEHVAGMVQSAHAAIRAVATTPTSAMFA